MNNEDGNRNNIIQPSGALQVIEPEPTWFQFLEISRGTNSTAGGWCGKSHWVSRGLNALAHADFITKWTTNSIRADVPSLRAEDFRFNREPSEARKSAAKGSENALNWRIYQSPTEEERKWSIVGYEIPLSDEASGQLKVDLFGVGDDGTKKFLSIVEIKKASNKSDSPLMALVEAICYAVQTIKCQHHLLKEQELIKKGLSEVHFQNIRIVLAAPSDYWTYWERDKHESGLREVLRRVNLGLPGGPLSLTLHELPD